MRNIIQYKNPRIRTVLFLGIILLLASCGHSNEDKIIRDAVRDNFVSLSEWEAIETVAKDNGDFRAEDGAFSGIKLKEYILDFARTKMRGIDNVEFDNAISFTANNAQSTAPILVNLYLERSGSMVPYDSPATNGEFKKSIVSLLNSLPQSQNDTSSSIYIVNDGVYPSHLSLRDLIKSKDIFGDTKSIGDPRYTDFTCIFDSILARTKSNELSVLVSDLIYSPKDLTNTNPQKILSEAEGITTSTFKGYENTGVVVVKLIGDYIGKYYTYKSPSQGINYNGERPFYFVLFGSNDILNKFWSAEEYKNLRNFKALPGFQNFYCFTAESLTPDYSILLSDKNNRGHFNAQKGQTKQIHAIENFKKSREGDRAMAIAIDLSHIPVNESIKNDPDNYNVESISGFEIESIIPLKSVSDKIARYVPGATHLIVLSTDEPVKNETIRVSLRNELPEWIESSNSDDDTDLGNKDFKNTTFSLAPLMKGIYKAKFSDMDSPRYFDITISIKK